MFADLNDKKTTNNAAGAGDNIAADSTTESAEFPAPVAEAKAAGFQVLRLTGEDDRQYYFKSPGKADMNRYLTSAAKGKLAAAAQNFVFDLAVYPDRKVLREKLNEKPGLVVALSNALQNVVGLNEEFEVKKL